MTAAVAPHKGVTKPDPALYNAVMASQLRAYWLSYRMWQRLAKRDNAIFARRYRDEYRGALMALCHLRRFCRPVRLGGAR